jgi:tetratricopeptide (TPR) repeat protein
VYKNLLVIGLFFVSLSVFADENPESKTDEGAFVLQLTGTDTIADAKMKEAYSYYLSAITCEINEDFTGAIKELNKAIEIKPDFAEAYDKRGVVNTKMYNYDKALRDLTKAINLKKNYAEAYSHRGIVQYVLQNFKKADADYTRAIEVNPQYAKAYYNRGLARLMLDDYTGAMLDMRQALDLNCKEAENILQNFNTFNANNY